MYGMDLTPKMKSSTKRHGVITQKKKGTSMRYFLVYLQNTRHRESMLNNDRNLHVGDNLLISKLRNGLMTRFFKIVGCDEALKYKYSSLGWDTAKSGRNSSAYFGTSLNCKTPHFVTSQITETSLILLVYTKHPQWQDPCSAQNIFPVKGLAFMPLYIAGHTYSPVQWQKLYAVPMKIPQSTLKISATISCIFIYISLYYERQIFPPFLVL
jgi:hypothetical protein